MLLAFPKGNEQARRGVKVAKEAILVIHGIGQQDPYETLDQFARGLVDQLQATPPQPLLISHEGWNEVAIRLDLTKKPTTRGISILDLYEFYWAPYTEGKITFLQTLNWLRRTVLSPLRHLASAYALYDQPDRPGRPRGAFLREILRILFLFLPVAAATWLLGYLIARSDRLQMDLSRLADIWRRSDLSHQIGLVALVVLAILIVTMINALRELRGEQQVVKAQGTSSFEQTARKRWARYAWITLGTSIPLVAILGWWLRFDLAQYWQAIRKHVLPVGAPAILVRWLKGLIVGYVGDIAVYANADVKASSYEARSKILKEVRKAILRLIRSPEGYERIVLAGHSLGSVIAYDVLNRLLDEVRAPYGTNSQGMLGASATVTAHELARLQGLVTFGSPLDKFYYFFRTEVPAEQAVRAQILSFMHGFRRAPSGRTYGIYQFPRYAIPDPSPDFTWINIWADADPVSGYLDFYQVAGPGRPNPGANQIERDYPWYLWGYAHVMYWSDRKFYELVANHLL